MSNEIEIVKAQLGALQKRVKVLEASVRPLTNLQGVDANLISDQAVAAFAAESIGSSLSIVTGQRRTNDATEARRRVAELLHTRAQWSLSRVGRALNRSVNGVKRLLEE